jgi:hypothetical protein
MNKSLVIVSVFALALAAMTGCGAEDSCAEKDSRSAEDNSVDLGVAFQLSDEEATALTGVWKLETDLPYSSFLQIGADRSHGFLCNNDGKSASSAVTFVDLEGQIGMEFVTAFGEAFEGLRYDNGSLVSFGTEKGVSYTSRYKKVPAFPAICERIKKGEVPTFEEYQASWDRVIPPPL